MSVELGKANSYIDELEYELKYLKELPEETLAETKIENLISPLKKEIKKLENKIVNQNKETKKLVHKIITLNQKLEKYEHRKNIPGNPD